MRLTKKQLKRIILEACGDMIPPQEEPLSLEKEPELEISASQAETSPCPFSTAEKLKASGMSDSEVLEWINTMLSSFLSVGDFSYTGDVGELEGDEAFGIGYEAGSRGF